MIHPATFPTESALPAAAESPESSIAAGPAAMSPGSVFIATWPDDEPSEFSEACPNEALEAGFVPRELPEPEIGAFNPAAMGIDPEPEDEPEEEPPPVEAVLELGAPVPPPRAPLLNVPETVLPELPPVTEPESVPLVDVCDPEDPPSVPLTTEACVMPKLKPERTKKTARRVAIMFLIMKSCYLLITTGGSGSYSSCCRIHPRW